MYPGTYLSPASDGRSKATLAAPLLSTSLEVASRDDSRPSLLNTAQPCSRSEREASKPAEKQHETANVPCISS